MTRAGPRSLLVIAAVVLTIVAGDQCREGINTVFLSLSSLRTVSGEDFWLDDIKAMISAMPHSLERPLRGLGDYFGWVEWGGATSRISKPLQLFSSAWLRDVAATEVLNDLSPTVDYGVSIALETLTNSVLRLSPVPSNPCLVVIAGMVDDEETELLEPHMKALIDTYSCVIVSMASTDVYPDRENTDGYVMPLSLGTAQYMIDTLSLPGSPDDYRVFPENIWDDDFIANITTTAELALNMEEVPCEASFTSRRWVWYVVATCTVLLASIPFLYCLCWAPDVKHRSSTQDSLPSSASHERYGPKMLRYFRAMFLIDVYLQRGFASWGAFVAKHPRAVMITCLIIIAPGVLFGYNVYRTGIPLDTDFASVWSDHNEAPFINAAYLYEQYPIAALFTGALHQVIIKNKDGTDIVNEADLISLRDLNSNLTSPDFYWEGNPAACFPWRLLKLDLAETCRSYYPTAFWDPINFSKGMSSIELTPDQEYDQDVLRTDLTYTNTEPIVPSNVLSLDFGEDDGQSTYARLTYFRIPGQTTKWNKYFDEVIQDFEASTDLEVLGTFDELDVPKAIDNATRGVNRAMFGFVVLVMVGYVVVSMWSSGQVAIGLMGVVSTGLAIASAMSLLIWLGNKVTPVIAVVPVISLGIGLDDMFLLLESRDALPKTMGVNKRVSKTLQAAGTSMLMTTMTDLLAFYVGTFSALDAVSSLSLFAFLSLLFDFLMQNTFFMAAMAIDTRRQAAQAPDIICCVTGCFIPDHGTALRTVAKNQSGHVMFTPSADGALLKEGEASHGTHESHGGLANWFGNSFGPFVVHKTWRWVIMVIFALFSLSCMAFLPLTVLDMPIGAALPFDEPVRDFLLDEISTFGGPITRDAFFFIDDAEFQYNTKENQALLLNFVQDLEDGDWIIPGSPVAWFKDMNTIAEYAGFLDDDGLFPEDTFYELVNLAVGNYSLYALDVQLNTDGGNLIRASKFAATLKPVIPGLQGVRYIQDLQNFVESHPAPVKVWSVNIQLYSAHASVIPNLFLDLTFTFIILFGVTAVFLVHPGMSLLVCFAMLFVVVDVIGLMAALGIKLNGFTEVTLVIAFGLSCDYLSHIAHGFLTSDGDPEARAVQTLAHHGPPVLSGALTTLAGVSVLIIFAHIEIILWFAYILILVQVIGLLHSFVFLPALLSAFGPTVPRNPFEDAALIAASKKPGPSLILSSRGGGIVGDLAELDLDGIEEIDDTAVDRAGMARNRAASEMTEKLAQSGKGYSLFAIQRFLPRLPLRAGAGPSKRRPAGGAGNGNGGGSQGSKGSRGSNRRRPHDTSSKGSKASRGSAKGSYKRSSKGSLRRSSKGSNRRGSKGSKRGSKGSKGSRGVRGGPPPSASNNGPPPSS